MFNSLARYLYEPYTLFESLTSKMKIIDSNKRTIAMKNVSCVIFVFCFMITSPLMADDTGCDVGECVSTEQCADEYASCLRDASEEPSGVDAFAEAKACDYRYVACHL